MCTSINHENIVLELSMKNARHYNPSTGADMSNHRGPGRRRGRANYEINSCPFGLQSTKLIGLTSNKLKKDPN